MDEERILMPFVSAVPMVDPSVQGRVKEKFEETLETF